MVTWFWESQKFTEVAEMISGIWKDWKHISMVCGLSWDVTLAYTLYNSG